MKKFLKFGAVLTALVLGLVCFAACGEEEDDGESSNNGGYVSNNGGGSTNNGGGNTNAEEEKPKRTVVAKWKYEKDASQLFIFYSDETYERTEKTTVVEKGSYYGDATKKGDLTIMRQMKWDAIANRLLEDPYKYGATIDLYRYSDDYLGIDSFLKLKTDIDYKYYLQM